MGLKNTRPEGKYVTIHDGSLRVRAEENQEGAIARTYEEEKEKGVKIKRTVWEFDYTELGGTVTKIDLKEGKFGRTINIHIGDGGDKYILSTATKNKYGSCMLKKLPNIDFTKSILFKPYDFTSDEGKELRGVTILQDDVKIDGAFWDPEAKKSLLGLPEVDEAKRPERSQKTKWENFWKAYFAEVEEFLVDYAEKNVLDKIPEVKKMETIEYPEEEINPDDVPF
jgi:hypothetical protein